MKYIPLLISSALILVGCQSTLKESPPISLEKSHQEQTFIDVASAIEINRALLASSPEAKPTDVIHPVPDVNIDLGKDAAKPDINNDLWQRIRNELSFEVPENTRLIKQRDWYINHPTYISRVAKRAEPFMFYIVQELEANNMPIEIAFLPIIESSFDPFAYSTGHASGMWQFVPGTGKRYGMKQNWWYDGRRDIVASTKGAISYLKYLHKFFDGDWMLALAAYNSGEGRVQRAVRSNKKKKLPTDFWSLDLPKETRDYVPKLLALANIVKNSKKFKIDLHKIENKAVIKQVDIGSQLDLAKAAQLAGLTLTELQHLNPGFNRWATDPRGPHYLLLPKHKVKSFNKQLEQLETKDRLTWRRYKIRNGDSLGKISKKFDTEIALIQHINNIKNDRIRAGKYLLLPVTSTSINRNSVSQNKLLKKLKTREQHESDNNKHIHIVKAGDTLWKLSRTYKVSTKNLAKYNNMSPKDTLHLGQKLIIANKVTVNNKNAKTRNITYKVRKGDSFSRIASKFNVTITDIERWNSLKREKYLQPGQELKLLGVKDNI